MAGLARSGKECRRVWSALLGLQLMLYEGTVVFIAIYWLKYEICHGNLVLS